MNIAQNKLALYNTAYIPFFRSKHKYQHLMGGAGSAKSHTAAQKILDVYMLPYKSVKEWESAMQYKYGKSEFDTLRKFGKIASSEKEFHKAMQVRFGSVDYNKKLQNGEVNPKKCKIANIRTWKEKIVLLRAQKNLVRYSQFELLRSMVLERGLDIDVDMSNLRLISKNGNEILCAGMRSGGADRIKSIPYITGFWIEEATDGGITFDDIKQLETRLRVVGCDSRIIFTYNPTHSAHWLNRYFWLNKHIKEDKDLAPETIARLNTQVFKLKTTYKDNAFLPQDYIDSLESKMYDDTNFYRVYALGEWGGNNEGCIIPKWSKTYAFPNACDKIVYGVDKGFEHPYAVVKVAYLPIDIVENGEIAAGRGLYVQEVVYQRHYTANQIINAYKDKLPTSAQYFISPEASSDKSDFRAAGYYITNGNNDVKNGIDYLRDMPIYVVCNSENHSINLISELMEYKYRIDKKLGMYTDVIEKKNDDLIDAFRYAAYTAFAPLKRKTISFAV